MGRLRGDARANRDPSELPVARPKEYILQDSNMDDYSTANHCHVTTYLQQARTQGYIEQLPLTVSREIVHIAEVQARAESDLDSDETGYMNTNQWLPDLNYRL